MNSFDMVGWRIQRISNLLRRQRDRSETAEWIDQQIGRSGKMIGYLISREGEIVCQRDIEEEFSMRRSTVSKLVKQMEGRGLVSRQSVHGDGRLKQIVLTDTARQYAQHIQREIDGQESEMLQGISPRDLEICKTVLDRIIYNLSEESCGRHAKKEDAQQ